MKLLRIMNVASDIKDPLLPNFLHQILEEKWKYNKAVHHLFTGFKKAVTKKCCTTFP
jgi:hypothetical protein